MTEGVGLDAEQVGRFEKFAAGERPWRLVYSAREARHLAAQPLAARAFCAAFCCKEAFYKALGEFYAFPEFECLYLPGTVAPDVVVAPALKERLGIGEVRMSIDEQFLAGRGEFVAEAYLIRPAGSHRETLEIAAVSAERERIEAEHFTPREIADLGDRRVQSLAGALALKRALVSVWADAGAGAAPRDFQLGHHANGAPRLVAAPEGVALESVFVSIAHTRQWAYGLAATAGDGSSAHEEPS